MKGKQHENCVCCIAFVLAVGGLAVGVVCHLWPWVLSVWFSHGCVFVVGLKKPEVFMTWKDIMRGRICASSAEKAGLSVGRDVQKCPGFLILIFKKCDLGPVCIFACGRGASSYLSLRFSRTGPVGPQVKNASC